MAIVKIVSHLNKYRESVIEKSLKFLLEDSIL